MTAAQRELALDDLVHHVERTALHLVELPRYFWKIRPARISEQP
jgi:hypothetical protein